MENGMKRVLTLLALTATAPVASLACEGEPPVMAPENPSGTLPATAASGSVQAPSEAPSAPPQMAMSACPPPPCVPPASTSAAASAGAALVAPESSTSAAAIVPPPTIPRGNVVGAVTTKPPAMSAQAVVY